MKIDIEKYYPSINYKILLNNLWEFNFHRLKLSRRILRYFNYEMVEFLKQSPIRDKGLPLGNYLSWVLAGFYLLPLDLKIHGRFFKNPG